MTTHLHYLVFKEQNLERIISQNQVKKLQFVLLCELFSSYDANPEEFIRFSFLRFKISIERR